MIPTHNLEFFFSRARRVFLRYRWMYVCVGGCVKRGGVFGQTMYGVRASLVIFLTFHVARENEKISLKFSLQPAREGIIQSSGEKLVKSLHLFHFG